MPGGFSVTRLQRLDRFLEGLVINGEAAGVAAMLTRRGETAYQNSFGYQDAEEKIPLCNDSIYRIFSMTKTFTAVTLLTLYEQGCFKLSDPVCAYLPSYANQQVAVTDGDGVQLVPVKQPVTIGQLFTMTSGIPYPGEGSCSERAMMEKAAEILRDGASGKTWNTARVVDEMAGVPLCFEPGTRYLYGFSHDVLGRLAEVFSGMSFGAYMREAVLAPLGLNDTGFTLSEVQSKRLAKAYTPSPSGLVPAALDGFLSFLTASSVFESGGGGLYSTLDDVTRFGQMLLNGGRLGDVRILSRKTVDLMRCNHLEGQPLRDFQTWHKPGYGYGLCVRSMLDPSRAGLNGSIGEWAWDGALGTWYCIDPAEELVAVFMIQRAPGGNEDFPMRFAQVVYGAIDD